jgi:uncharacterized protein with PQ loop repeat
MTFTPTEIIGYTASLLVLISFLMKDIRSLRLINSVGCSLFVVYGVLLNFSWPIIFTNTAILLINFRALAKKPD